MRRTKLDRLIDNAIKEVRAACTCNWKVKRCSKCTKLIDDAVLEPLKFLKAHDARMKQEASK